MASCTENSWFEEKSVRSIVLLIEGQPCTTRITQHDVDGIRVAVTTQNATNKAIRNLAQGILIIRVPRKGDGVTLSVRIPSKMGFIPIELQFSSPPSPSPSQKNDDDVFEWC